MAAITGTGCSHYLIDTSNALYCSAWPDWCVKHCLHPGLTVLVLILYGSTVLRHRQQNQQ